MKIQCKLSPEEVAEIVRKEILLRFVCPMNLKHVTHTNNFDETIYDGVEFEVEVNG